MLHVALLDEPVERGINDELGVPPVEPSGQPCLEQLLDAVWPSLLVVPLQGQRRPALLRAAPDWAVVHPFVLVHIYSLLLSMGVHTDEVLL